MTIPVEWIVVFLLTALRPVGAEDDHTVFDDIDLGKRRIAELPVGKNEVLLAAKNPAGQIVPVTIKINTRSKGAGSTLSSNPPGFAVQWEKLNGVNTDFDIFYPQGYTVLALKRQVRQHGSFDDGAAVYVPYTDSLDREEVRTEALRYMEDCILEAQYILRTLGVRSRAFPGKLVADTVPLELALILSLVEHIDPVRFQREPIDQLMNEVLVIIGANKEVAYKYAVSHRANARGLFQFIRRTYLSVTRLYPSAKLSRDFIAGMDDHVNAAAASLLLFDSDLSNLLYRRKHTIVELTPHARGLYLSAAYNGGAPKALRAVDAVGLLRPEKLRRKETRVYVHKYQRVSELLRLQAIVFHERFGVKTDMAPAERAAMP